LALRILDDQEAVRCTQLCDHVPRDDEAYFLDGELPFLRTTIALASLSQRCRSGLSTHPH